jgi:hypothetical protein
VSKALYNNEEKWVMGDEEGIEMKQLCCLEITIQAFTQGHPEKF